MLNYESKDFYLSLFQKLRYSLTIVTKFKNAVNMADPTCLFGDSSTT